MDYLIELRKGRQTKTFQVGAPCVHEAEQQVRLKPGWKIDKIEQAPDFSQDVNDMFNDRVVHGSSIYF